MPSQVHALRAVNEFGRVCAVCSVCALAVVMMSWLQGGAVAAITVHMWNETSSYFVGTVRLILFTKQKCFRSIFRMTLAVVRKLLRRFCNKVVVVAQQRLGSPE